MKESVLKKEFRERDVKRARNLLTGNAGGSTQVGIGYEAAKKEYVEGDIWEQDGKQWTIKNGLKQTITKLDEIKKLYSLPYSCPCCKKSFADTPTNRKMWGIHKMCLTCVIDMEAKLKIEGKYKEYEKQMMNGNKNAMVTDLEAALEGWLGSSNTFVTENGEVESWGKKVGNDKDTDQFRELLKTLKDQEI